MKEKKIDRHALISPKASEKADIKIAKNKKELKNFSNYIEKLIINDK